MNHQFGGSIRNFFGTVFICSSVAVFAFDITLHGSPMAVPFSLPFKDDFESYSPGTMPKEFVEQAGTFDVFARTDGQGKCLRLVLPKSGIGQTTGSQPYATIGNPDWSDYDVTADVLIEKKGGFAFVLGRVGKISGPADSVPDGYRLVLNNAASQWRLYAASDLLASGPANAANNTWHNLRLAMQGVSLRCYVDGALVTNYIDSTFINGMAGIGCDRRGAEFDNFALSEVHAGTGFNLALAATASASSVWQDDPTYGANMANDGDPETRWNTAYPTEDTEWL